MSLNENIAQLTGTLRFAVETGGFRRFETMMKNANTKMVQLANQYQNLATNMGKGLKLNVDTSALDKAKTKLESALKRQTRAEAALANQQRSTFAQEISQQKLKYAGSKAQASIDSAMLKSQKEAAVVAAKAQAFQARNTGSTKQQRTNQNALTASLTRQAKLQAIVQKTASASQKAADAHLASQTKLQRVQQQIDHGYQQAQIKAQAHAAKMAATQQTAANKTQSSNQSAARFQMTQQRHAVWQAKQNAPKATPASNGLLGGGLNQVIAYGALGAGLAGISAAINKLGARVEERKKSVVDAERFDAAFVPLGKSQETRDQWKKTYVDLSTQAGVEISNETAEDFRTFVAMQQASGKKTDDIIKEYKLRQQAFTISGLTKDSSREVNRQFNQVATDGIGDKSDWNVISERMPMLVPYVTRAFGDEEKISDPTKAAAAFNKRMKKGGGVKLEWLNKAMETMVAEQQGVFENKKNTVSFVQTLSDNQSFLNQVGINNSKELSQAMRDNIAAHRELNEAMQPTARAMADFDKALTIGSTSLIRFAIGRNQDGSVKTEQQQTIDRMSTADLPVSQSMVGTPDFSKVDSDNRRQTGPIGEFWNWALGIQDKVNQRPALGEPVIPSLSINPSLFKIEPSLGAPAVPSAPQMPALFDTFSRMQDVMGDSHMSKANQTQTFNSPITVEGANVSVTINGSATEQDRTQMMDFISKSLDEQQRKFPEVARSAVTEMLVSARAQQAERM
jgi:hypothetical protein